MDLKQAEKLVDPAGGKPSPPQLMDRVVYAAFQDFLNERFDLATTFDRTGHGICLTYQQLCH